LTNAMSRRLSATCWAPGEKAPPRSTSDFALPAHTFLERSIACPADSAPRRKRNSRNTGAITPLPPEPGIVVFPSCSLDSMCVRRRGQGFVIERNPRVRAYGVFIWVRKAKCNPASLSNAIFLGIVPEGPVTHLEQFCGACSNAVARFQRGQNIGLLQILNMFFQVHAGFRNSRFALAVRG